MRVARLLFALFAAFAASLPALAEFPGDRIRIAVEDGVARLAGPGELEALEAAVRRSNPGIPVNREVLGDKALRERVEEREAELFLATSAFYRGIGLAGVRDVATILPVRGTDPNRSGGGVLVSRMDRLDLSGLGSLKGKTVALSRDFGFFGSGALFAEVARLGGTPEEYFSRVVETEPGADALLRAVREGKADAAFIPACLLERDAEAGTPRATLGLRVLGPLEDSGLRCAHSTTLYPGVILAATPSIPPERTGRLLQELLSEGSWGVTTDFSETDRSLRLLDLDANARLRKWSLERIWRDYRPWILFSIALLVLLVCYSFLVGWLVRRRTAELAASLARERAADSRARAASDRIAKMEKIGLLGQVSGLFAHEIRQPLSVIAIHAWSLRRMAQRGDIGVC